MLVKYKRMLIFLENYGKKDINIMTTNYVVFAKKNIISNKHIKKIKSVMLKTSKRQS